MPINVVIMRRKLCRDLKIVFVSGLIVSFFPEFPLSTHSILPQLAFLGLMFLPSVERFLARQVVVELTKLTEPTRKSPTGPAVTFCPYNQSR